MEMEWERAARQGTTGDRYSENLDWIVWYADNGGDRAHPVGEKVPNRFGLHDMLGNVWECVQDWYGAYLGGDPAGAVDGGMGGQPVRADGQRLRSGRDLGL